MRLIGKIVMYSDENRFEFQNRLSSLMAEYKVAALDVCWDYPDPCPRCGEMPMLEVEMAENPAENDEKPKAMEQPVIASKDEAFQVLGGIVDKMDKRSEPLGVLSDFEDGEGD